MSKKVFIGIGIVVVVAIVAVAAYVLRPAAEASAPIEAIPVEVKAVETDPIDQPETVSDPEMAEATSAGEMAAPENMVIFTIVQDESEARFTLDEILRGEPTTVVGATHQVAGEIAIDPENPANSKVGTISINARTLKTDNDFRNRAIHNEILETSKYEFISFMPTGLNGFPENPQIGETLSFQIVGDLTIRDITQAVTFAARVTVISENRMEGYASTLIPRADYDLRIPNVPSVAEVDEEVLVEIEFVAVNP